MICVSCFDLKNKDVCQSQESLFAYEFAPITTKTITQVYEFTPITQQLLYVLPALTLRTKTYANQKSHYLLMNLHQ